MFWKILQYWQRQRARQHWLLFILGLLLFTVALSIFNGIGQLDRLIVDTATRFDGRKPSSDIVIIGIDDDSIYDYGQWPWPRSMHAELLERLHDAGVRAVGLDIVFTEPDRNRPIEDEMLANAIELAYPVALPIFTSSPADTGGWIEVHRPISILKDKAAALVLISLDPDSDGVARGISLRQGRDGVGGGVWYHMAAQLWMFGQGADVDTNLLPGERASRQVLDVLDRVEQRGANGRIIFSDWLNDHSMLIAYAGPPNSFQRYSYRDVLAGKVSEELLRDKYVLVGSLASGLGDAYSTPMSGQDALMPGVEIIANILDSLIQQDFRYKASVLQNILYNLLPVLFAIPLFYLGRPRTVLVGCLILILLDFLCMFLLRRYVGLQVAPAASLICLILAYPLWSWRRLEKAMRQIRMEFSRMRRENGFFRELSLTSGDKLERDLQAFENAAWQLRDLQQMVRQSLDELPYILLLTNEEGQVILANTEARRMFNKVDPPLPTMAFEPAMGLGDGSGQGTVFDGHHLSQLLAPRILASLLSQHNSSYYAADWLAFLLRRTNELNAGVLEVTDMYDGRSYLLKIVPRVMTIERSLGWIVTLVNLSGERKSEVQRDQVLRYLQDNVETQLAAWDTELTQNSGTNQQVQQGVGQLRTQIQSFLNFIYAQVAIYVYEEVNLSAVFADVFEGIAKQSALATDSALVQKYLRENVSIIRGDMQILYRAVGDLVQLLVEVSEGKLPQIKFTEVQAVDKGSQSLGRVQLLLMALIGNDSAAQQKSTVFDQPVQNAGLPADATPELLGWWAIHTTMTRHAATIKVQKTSKTLGMMLEFYK